MRPRRRRPLSSGGSPLQSAAVRLAIGLLVGSVTFALLRDGVGPALLLAPGDILGRLWLWQPLTYGFVETSPLGVIFGALILWQLGGALEQSWGRRRMLAFLLGTTVLAGVLTTALALVLGPLVLMRFQGGMVMGLTAWVAYGLTVGRAGSNFWGIPVSGNVLALIGAGFVFLEGAFSGWLLIVPSTLALLLSLVYVRLGGPGVWWLQFQSWRLRRSLRGRAKHLKVVAPDRNTRSDSDRYLH